MPWLVLMLGLISTAGISELSSTKALRLLRELHGNTCEELLAAADNAMYAAKRTKTNPVQVSRVLASSNC